MSPIIHCIRHGQGFHNAGAGSYTLRDPHLTPLGEQQSETLRVNSFLNQSQISLVIASPLCRTLHTASLIFKPALTSSDKCQPRILALPDIQETSDDLCDIGSEPSQLQSTVTERNWPIDLSLVKEGWNVKTSKSRYSPHSDAIALRTRDARLTLRQIVRDLVKNGDVDAQLAVVTHGSFLHFLTGDWEDSWLYPATGWRNCETRSYVFERGFWDDGDKEARLIETKESRLERRKKGPMMGREEQSALFEFAMQEWENQGLQRPDKIEDNLV
ncbi:histidine phosphatase superfamily [Leptodontidium sp. MPI-SDFR-AT-0119]|nr:histidine phosphatase superfamily [Leptodontidium sp. MPI-SDFR-AT-0119]